MARGYSFVPSFFLTAALSRKVEGLGPLKPWQPVQFLTVKGANSYFDGTYNEER